MRKKIAVGLVLIASLSACGGGGGAPGAWSQAQKDELVAGCSQVGSAGGADANKVKAYCECSADVISKKYSYEDAKKLDQEALTNQEKMNELMEAVNSCLVHMQ